jgi:putative transposase
MPDHLHVLLTPGDGTPIEKAMQMIKGGSAYRIRKELGFRWPVWQPGFHDRWIRDEQEYLNCKHYILQNPVKARLAQSVQEYTWASANGQYQLDEAIFDELQGLKPQS